MQKLPAYNKNYNNFYRCKDRTKLFIRANTSRGFMLLRRSKFYMVLLYIYCTYKYFIPFYTELEGTNLQDRYEYKRLSLFWMAKLKQTRNSQFLVSPIYENGATKERAGLFYSIVHFTFRVINVRNGLSSQILRSPFKVQWACRTYQRINRNYSNHSLSVLNKSKGAFKEDTRLEERETMRKYELKSV